jgi:drug/metabolite transporter (DMT)-like permease
MSRYVFALSAAVCWGVSPLFAKLGMAGGLSALAANVVATILAIPPFFVLALLLARGAWKLEAGVLPLVAASGVLNAIGVTSLFAAVKLSPIAPVAIIISGGVPLLTFILAHFFLRRERVTWRLVAGTLLLTVGVYLGVG